MMITGFPAAKVTIPPRFWAGGFGRRLDADLVTDAVEISKAVKKPVKVTGGVKTIKTTSTAR